MIENTEVASPGTAQDLVSGTRVDWAGAAAGEASNFQVRGFCDLPNDSDQLERGATAGCVC